MSDRKVDIVGTSHISQESVETIEERFNEGKEEYNMIAVELDEERFSKIQQDSQTNTDIGSLIDQNKVLDQVVLWGLSYYQKRVSEKTGVEPGSDMKKGIELAEENNIALALVDRNIQVTIDRIINSIRLRDIAVMLYSVLTTIFYTLVYGIDNLKQRVDEEVNLDDPEDEQVEELLEEFKRLLPNVYSVLLDERNKYMAAKLELLRRENDGNILAIVGAGHESGVKTYLKEYKTVDDAKLQAVLSKLEKTKKSKLKMFAKIVGYLFMSLVIFSLLLLLAGGIRSIDLLIIVCTWIGINGIAVYSIARFFGASQRSSLLGGSIAWLTSINPTLAPGWFVGYSELKYRNDLSVNDFSKIETIIEQQNSVRKTLKELYNIPSANLIITVAAVNVASMIASLIFLFIFLPYFSVQFELVDVMREGLQTII